MSENGHFLMLVLLIVVCILGLAWMVEVDSQRDRDHQLSMLKEGWCQVYVPPSGWSGGRWEYQRCLPTEPRK